MKCDFSQNSWIFVLREPLQWNIAETSFACVQDTFFSLEQFHANVKPERGINAGLLLRALIQICRWNGARYTIQYFAVQYQQNR